MRPQYADARRIGFQCGPSMLTQRVEEFNKAVVRSYTWARDSMRPQCADTQEPRFQCDPSALMHRGHEFNGAPMRSCTGANILI